MLRIVVKATAIDVNGNEQEIDLVFRTCFLHRGAVDRVVRGTIDCADPFNFIEEGPFDSFAEVKS